MIRISEIEEENKHSDLYDIIFTNRRVYDIISALRILYLIKGYIVSRARTGSGPDGHFCCDRVVVLPCASDIISALQILYQ